MYVSLQSTCNQYTLTGSIDRQLTISLFCCFVESKELFVFVYCFCFDFYTSVTHYHRVFSRSSQNYILLICLKYAYNRKMILFLIKSVFNWLRFLGESCQNTDKMTKQLCFYSFQLSNHIRFKSNFNK